MATAIDRLAGRLSHNAIRRHGKRMTYVHTAATAFVDGGGTVHEQPDPPEYPLKGLLRDVRRDWIDGTLVQATDKQILVARQALPVEPRKPGLVKIGARTLTIVDVRPRYSGELIWGFYLIVRG
jgi:hypothetical protein